MRSKGWKTVSHAQSSNLGLWHHRQGAACQPSDYNSVLFQTLKLSTIKQLKPFFTLASNERVNTTASQQLLGNRGVLCFLEGGEAERHGLAPGVQAAVHDHAVQLLQAAAVELAHLEAGGHVPDVAEGDLGELAAPLGGDADAAAQGHDGVAQRLAALEAFVGVAPHAGGGVDAGGLGEDVLERHLKVVIDVVGIAVEQIKRC